MTSSSHVRWTAVAFALAGVLSGSTTTLCASDSPQPGKQEQMVAMRDGVRLATDVWLPNTNGPFPVVFLRFPYNKAMAVGLGQEGTARGYAVVAQDTRGRFASEGANLPFHLDVMDGKETVKWIARQPWCNGRIGTWGGSAGAITQFQMAVGGTDQVSAQYLIVGAPNLYDVVYVGGVFRKSLIEDWLSGTQFATNALGIWESHPTYDAYWEARDASPYYAAISTPAVHVGGYWDIFAQATIDGFVGYQTQGGEGARGRQKLLLGPWSHAVLQEKVGELTFPNGKTPPGQLADHWRWFDHWLHDQDNGVGEDPAVTYYVLGDTANPDAPGNEWRTADRWPPMDTVPTRYHLRADRSLSTAAPGDDPPLAYTYDPQNPAPTIGGIQLTLPAGPMDQSRVESREDVLVFTSETLTAPLEVIGRVRAHLWIASDAPDTDFFVRLCDVYPDGRSFNLCEGMLRTRFRNGFDREVMLEPGEIVPLDIDVWSTGVILAPDHRLRVHVTSSSVPGFDPNPNTGEAFRSSDRTQVARNTVYVDAQRPSHIVLPVVAATGSTAKGDRRGANLALVATPSASYVSGDTSVAALNDNQSPRSSRDNRRGSYGNWNRTGTQWAQYDWTQPISTDRVEVYWWDDRRGVRLPAVCRVMMWNGTEFVSVPNAVGLGVAGDQFNVTTFDEVRTPKLRLEIDGNDTYSTGLLEWRVMDSGNSPAFPPRVEAGVDRVVVVGGRTFLNGAVRSLNANPEATQLSWTAVERPGVVTLENATALSTTATFSQEGEYVLRLSAQADGLEGSDTLRVRVLQPLPKPRMEPVATGVYRVQSPLWSARLKTLIVNWIPHCIEQIEDPDLKEGGINNFVAAANKLADRPHEAHRGYVFANAWVYNTMEAICLALGVDAQGDPEILKAQVDLKATLDRWIPQILAAQEPDGYLQTAFTLDEQRERWSSRNRGDHEGYVAGYFLEAAVAYTQWTQGQDLRLYHAARRLADCWNTHIGPSPKQPWWDGHQAMEMALVRFGRFVNEFEGTGQGNTYIALAKFLLDCRQDGSAYDQSHLPVIQQYEAVGHAVRAVYSYAAMADIVLETGDPDYQSAVFSLWDNIVNRKYYVTGGVGSGETSEGFGPDYSLRHNGYCESCSSSGEIFFQHKLNLATGDARYADLYEETLYNALLGSMDLEGKNFYYQNPLNSRRTRYPWHVCPCCVGNIPRTLLSLPTWTYARSTNGIAVNLYLGSTVTVPNVAGTDVELIQTTDHPWSEDVSITVNPARPTRFTLRLRNPDRDVSELYTAAPRADGLGAVTLNGHPVMHRVDRGYAVLDRVWKAGDRLELKLPMPVQRIRAIDLVEATRGRVALRRGPLIYNVEQFDQDIRQELDPATTLNPVWKPELLDGVMALEGLWASGEPLLAIPNYARNNRGGRNDESTDRRGPQRPSSIVWIEER